MSLLSDPKLLSLSPRATTQGRTIAIGDVVTRSQDGSLFIRGLYDLQTGEGLAFAKIQKSEKVGMVSDRLSDMRNDLGFSDANEYINKIMQEDR